MKWLYGMTPNECEIAKTFFDEVDGSYVPATAEGMRWVKRSVEKNNGSIDLSRRHIKPSDSAKEFVKGCFLDAKRRMDDRGLDGKKFTDLLAG